LSGPRAVVRVVFSDRLQEAELAARTFSDGAFDPARGRPDSVAGQRETKADMRCSQVGQRCSIAVDRAPHRPVRAGRSMAAPGARYVLRTIVVGVLRGAGIGAPSAGRP